MSRIPTILVMAAALMIPLPACAGKALRVAVDIGHSPESKGAPSARNKPEYEFNREMAFVVIRELRRDRRIEPVLINPEGEDISLQKRAELVNSVRPDLLISIHHDSVKPGYLTDWTYKGAPAQFCDKYFGFSIFVSDRNARSEASRSFALRLGKAMRNSGIPASTHHAEMVQGEGKEPIDARVGVYRFDGLVVLRETACPAVLLECGIIRNRTEEMLLRNRAYRLRIARAIRSAVSGFKMKNTAHRK